jgi:hypothetical protein
MNGFCKIRGSYIGGGETDDLRMLDYIIEKVTGYVKEERGIRQIKNSIVQRIRVDNSKIEIKIKSRGRKVAHFSREKNGDSREDCVEQDVMEDLRDVTVELTDYLSKHIYENKDHLIKYRGKSGEEENNIIKI